MKTMRRIIFLAAMCCLLCATSLFAYDFQYGDLYYNILKDKVNEVEVTYETPYIFDYDNYPHLTNANIPSTVTYNGKTYSVTRISGSAFCKCTNLKSVTIPNSVTEIGSNAFYGCTSLPIVDNLRYADTYLVEAVDFTLSTYNIKQGTKWIGDGAFYGCTKLESITIPNSVTSIGDDCFFYCGSLTSINIPNSVTSIGVRAFGLTSLKSVNIPNGVTKIGSSAFYNCENLSIYITDIAAWCNIDFSLDDFYNENDQFLYDKHLFLNGNEIKDLVLPNSVTSIKSSAFRGCESLISITIPNSVTSIGESAFYGCESLISITIPNSVTSIGNSTFYGCESLISVTIPNSVTSIGEKAFYGCTSLTFLTIPQNVTNIGEKAFYGCDSLVLNVECPIKENMFRAGDTKYVSEHGIKELYIGDNVDIIGEGAFAGCANLKKVVIGNGVEIIRSDAFSYCENLEFVVLGKSVRRIESRAFEACDNLLDMYMYCNRIPTYDDSEKGNSFYNANKNMYVWVPQNMYDDYRYNYSWGSFIIKAMAAESVNTDKVLVTPDYNTANVAWPSVGNADTYELVIKDKQGNEICTLVFNSNGQLQSIAVRAPAVSGSQMPEQTAASGFRFTVTGLESGSKYDYSITAKDLSGKTIQNYTGTFYTLGATGVEDIEAQTNSDALQATKVLENGIMYILLHDGRKYNLQGAEVM